MLSNQMLPMFAILQDPMFMTTAKPISVISVIVLFAGSVFSQTSSMLPRPLASASTGGVDKGESDQTRKARGDYFDRFSQLEEGITFETMDPRTPPLVIAVTPGPKAELPGNMVDLIVLGKITAIQPYFATKHAAIYTESLIEVERVFNSNGSHSPVDDGLVILQQGGATILPSGRIINQAVSGAGRELKLGERYVLFLVYLPQLKGYGCVKAWNLINGVARPVSQDDLAKSQQHRSTYDGMDEKQFLLTVQKILTSSVPVVPR
jgi:hypothetical protein